MAGKKPQPKRNPQGRSPQAKTPQGAKQSGGARQPSRALATKPKDEVHDRARPSSQSATAPRTRTARLRLIHLDPWSVGRTTFLLSVVLGVAMVVAVFFIWLLLAGTGVWDSINHSVRDTVGSTTTVPFDITNYLGLGRVVGFAMLAAVINAILMTAIATLMAFLYNLSANLLGGVEATYAEER